MNIINASVSAHIRKRHDIEAEVNEQEGHKHITLRIGGPFGVTLYINDREKALEIASLLERAAHKWIADDEILDSEREAWT